jgi:hypothetical protein
MARAVRGESPLHKRVESTHVRIATTSEQACDRDVFIDGFLMQDNAA